MYLGKKFNFFQLCLILNVSCLCLSSCSSKSEVVEPQPTEIKLNDSDLPEAPEEISFLEAKKLYRAGLFSVAKDSFDALKQNFPNSPYAEFAEIKVADSLFNTKEYQAAAAQYEEFVKNHPGSKAVPYMLLQAGLSYDLVNLGIGRDVSPLEKALGFYNQVIEKYPNTVYAQEARRHKISTTRRIAAYEQSVIDFYNKRAKNKASAARELAFKNKYGQQLVSNLNSETLNPNIGSQSSLDEKLQPEQEFKPKQPTVLFAATLLNASQGNSATTDVTLDSNARASLKKIEGLGLTSEQESTNDPIKLGESSQTFNLQKIACTQGKIFIHLDRAIQKTDFLAMNKDLSPLDGQIRVALQQPVSKAYSINCFAVADLKIKQTGEIFLETKQSATLLTLDHPPRLLIVLK